MPKTTANKGVSHRGSYFSSLESAFRVPCQSCTSRAFVRHEARRQDLRAALAAFFAVCADLARCLDMGFCPCSPGFLPALEPPAGSHIAQMAALFSATCLARLSACRLFQTRAASCNRQHLRIVIKLLLRQNIASTQKQYQCMTASCSRGTQGMVAVRSRRSHQLARRGDLNNVDYWAC